MPRIDGGHRIRPLELCRIDVCTAALRIGYRLPDDGPPVLSLFARRPDIGELVLDLRVGRRRHVPAKRETVRRGLTVYAAQDVDYDPGIGHRGVRIFQPDDWVAQLRRGIVEPLRGRIRSVSDARDLTVNEVAQRLRSKGNGARDHVSRVIPGRVVRLLVLFARKDHT